MKAKKTFPFVIILSLVLAYLNSLSNGFVWIDQAEILNKQLIISDFSEFMQIFLSDDNNYQGYHRPMYNLMHTMDYILWGENAFGFHLSSLILHIANTLLIYFIGLNFSCKRLTSTFIALFFGLLPCHTATVSLIHSKGDLLACFFVLLPILLYSHTEFRNNKSPSLSKLVLWCTLFLIALLSKEVAIMLPFFVISISYLLAKQKISFPKSLLIYPTIVGIIFIIFRLSTTDTITNPDALGLADRVLSFIPVYVNYITQTLTGFELTTNDAVKVWSHMSTGAFALYAIGFLLLLATQYYFSKKNVVIAAGFLWFNLFLIPVSQLIPILHFRADRFMYLPSIGFILSMAYIVLYYYEKQNWARYKKPMINFLGAILVISSFRIWDRNRDFSSDQVMFSKLIKDHPECREAQGFIGNNYLINNDYENALVHINLALQDQTEYYSYANKKTNYGNLGVIYLHQNKTKEALDVFLQLKAFGNHSPEVYFNIGICYKRLKNFQKAKSNLEQYLEHKPNNIDALFNLGAIGVELGDKAMMEKYFRRYLELNPTSEYRATLEDLFKSG